MCPNPRCNGFKRAVASDHFSTEVSMPSHRVPLVCVELAGFLENGVWHPDLADVVKKTGNSHSFDLERAHPQRFCQAVSQVRNALRMELRHRIASVQSLRQQFQCLYPFHLLPLGVRHVRSNRHEEAQETNSHQITRRHLEEHMEGA